MKRYANVLRNFLHLMKLKMKLNKKRIFHGVKKLASEFSKEISQLVKIFPDREKYILANDFLRAARSIPANIACPV